MEIINSTTTLTILVFWCRHLQALPDLPEFPLSLRPDDYELPEVGACWSSENGQPQLLTLKAHLKDEIDSDWSAILIDNASHTPLPSTYVFIIQSLQTPFQTIMASLTLSHLINNIRIWTLYTTSRITIFFYRFFTIWKILVDIKWWWW